MMWSQCGCDKNILKVCLPPGPCSRSTWLPNSRTPVPRSQITYSSPPVMISTQLVLPPKVPRTENGSRAVYEGIDRLLGLERVPASGEQRIADLGADRPLPQRCRQRAAGAPKADTQRSGRFGLGIGNRPLGARRRLPGSARFLDGGEDRDDMREPADREDLAHDRMETGDAKPTLFRLQPRGSHQRPQTGARDVFDSGKVNDDVRGAGADGGEQPRLKLGAREIVDASDRSQYQDVCLAPLADIHGRTPVTVVPSLIVGSSAARSKNCSQLAASDVAASQNLRLGSPRGLGYW